MKSLFPDVCTDDLPASRDFYVSLLGLEVLFEIDWYVQLRHPGDENLQIAFIARENASVPAGDRDLPRGVIVTVETDDVDGTHERARELGLEIVVDLTDEEWGQRHFVTRDPNGLLVDVFCLIPPTREFQERHGLA